jgi:hypothetical protein
VNLTARWLGTLQGGEASRSVLLRRALDPSLMLLGGMDDGGSAGRGALLGAEEFGQLLGEALGPSWSSAELLRLACGAEGVLYPQCNCA